MPAAESVWSTDWTDTSKALHHRWMIIDSEDTLFRRKLEADQETASGRYLAAAAHWDSFGAGASDEQGENPGTWDAEKTAEFRTASQELRTASEAMYTASEALRRYITTEAKDTPPRS
jgi:hypothetical protein